MTIVLLTAAAMIAFAANSVLARLALGDGDIDPGAYVLVRLAAGALVLALLVLRRAGGAAGIKSNGSWVSAAALFAYAAGFAFAYLALDTGTGALILFATVQATMIGWTIYKGDRPILLEWVGIVVAFGALVWFVSPGLSAPDPVGAALMTIAGIAWGIYSLRGRSARSPLLATAGNFVRSVPMAIVLFALFIGGLQLTPYGLVLAIASGALTSGLGYAIWYRALEGLSGTQAAIIQLSVPVIAASGGIVFGGEMLTPRFAASAVLILGGIALAILARRMRPNS